MKFQFLFFVLSTIFVVFGEETNKPLEVEKGEKLIQSVLKGIELKNEKSIGELFENSFIYEACDHKKYNKEETVKLVNSLGIEMAKIMEKSTEIVSIGHGKFITIVANSAIISEFIVSKNWKLEYGKTIVC